MYQKGKICLVLILAFISSTISFAQIRGWESQESNTEAYLTDVFFINADTGWVTGHGVLLNTADGGENWTMQDSIDAYFMSVFFKDENEGWAVGFKEHGEYYGIFYHTTDGGEQWILKDSTRWDLNDICFINADTGFAVGGGRSKTTLLRTYDAGTSWEEMDGYGGHLYTVQFVNDTLGWAAGERGAMLKTEDGGNTWTTTYLDVGQFNLTSLSFVNPDTGWVVGSDKIHKTTNGGETWETQDCEANSYYSGCFFKNSNSGWVCTSESQSFGKIFFTEDGGNSWILQKAIEYTSLKSIFYLDDSTAWCVGGTGTILKATSEVMVSIGEIGSIQEKPSQGKGLHQNYPNPFSLETTLSYKLSNSGPVRLTVYNLLGEELAVLVDKTQAAGSYELLFDGSGLTSGIYYYRLSYEGGSSVKKMQVIR